MQENITYLRYTYMIVRYNAFVCAVGQTVGVCPSPPTAATPWQGELPFDRADVLPQLSRDGEYASYPPTKF